MLLSLAWKLNESWISRQPMLAATYMFEPFGYYICLLIRCFNGIQLLDRWLSKRGDL